MSTILQATFCVPGIDHTRLTYKYQGRHFRLTDVTECCAEDSPGLKPWAVLTTQCPLCFA